MSDEQKPKISLDRVKMRQQDCEERIKNFDEVELGFSQAEAMKEATRCLQCKHKPCVQGCPIHIEIPAFIKAIRDNNFQEAILKIRETHLFSSFCGRVCPQEQQCEKSCVLNPKGAPIAIGGLERFVGDLELKHAKEFPFELKPKNGKRVAVVGSGPSGLTVAGELIQAGFEVTIFEALHEPGGVLAYGIPEFRLPKKLVNQVIQRLQDNDVKIIYNTIIGKSITVDELLQEEHFDAVFIGTGAGLPNLLNIPGEDSVGVYTANEYLTRVNLMKAYQSDAKTPIIKGDVVVTVGGGNVSMDTARVALRLGAKRSMIIYRRTEADMPARIEEINHAKEEGVEFYTLCTPVEIIADEKGFIDSIRCTKMKMEDTHNSDKKRPVPIENSEFEIPCRTFIIAIGNKPNPLIQNTTLDLAVSDHGTIITDEKGRTSKPFVYAGGDVVSGAATVVLAIDAGKKASQAIIEDLEQQQ